MDMEMDGDAFEVEAYDCNDPTNEQRPDSVVYTEIFRDLRECNTEAAQLLREPLLNSKFQNVITHGLKQEIAKRKKEDFPDTVTLAVVGDMQAGKSSVINSILSIGTIARKGDGGNSCTWVVQRYMNSFPGQNASFAAKVYFFNRDEIRSILDSLLAKYFNAANKEAKDEDEDNDEQSSGVEAYGDMRDTVVACMALFCEHDEFESEGNAHAFLKEMKSEHDEAFLEVLLEWAVEVVHNALEGLEAKTFETSTAEELLWRLQPFTYQVGGIDGAGVIAPWPLVCRIDFGLDHPLLKEGIIFVDSPGLSDANAARSKNAVNQHRQCTHLIAVAHVGRAEDDLTLRKVLESGYRTRGSGKTMLVLTRGDSIDAGTEVTGTPSEKKRVTKLDAEIKTLRDQKKKVQQEAKGARYEDRDEFDEELRSISKDMMKLTKERDSYRLEMRNRKVVTRMQDIYKGLTQDPRPLSAFAVGNEVYEKYQAGFNADDKPYLSVKQTNIPALRHRLYTMPVEGRFNDTMNLAEIQLPNLVTSFELYCSELHMARKGEIEAIIIAPKAKLTAAVRLSFEKLKKGVVDTILEPMKDSEEEWLVEARKLCRFWTEEYRGSLAIIKRNGVQKTKKKKAKDVNWNTDLQNIGRKTLDAFFGDFKKVSRPWADYLAANVSKLCDGSRNAIKDDKQFHTMPLGPFLRGFNGEKKNISRLATGMCRKMSCDISTIVEKSTMYSEDAFLPKAMEPIYEELQKIKGAGGPKKRADRFERLVTKNNGILLKVHDSIERAFDNVFHDYEGKMVEVFGQVFDSLHNNFRLLCAGTETKDEKEKVQEQILRKELKENLAKVKAMVEEGGIIPELVEKCKKYSSQANSSQLFV